MITDEIKAYAQTLLEVNPLYAKITQDIGVLAVMDSLSYKLDSKLREYANVIAEYYSPESEAVLLSKLLYQQAYIRFKQPMIIKAKIKDENTLTINKDEVFTDGISSYLVKESVSCIGTVETNIEFIQASIKEVSQIVGTGLYTHIFTDTYYQDIHKIIVTRNDIEIDFSQQFTDDNKDCMLEVNPDAQLSIVVRLNNQNGSNITINDLIKAKIYISKDITTPPDALSIVATGYNNIVTEIEKKENFTPALSKENMRDIILYNKNIANTLVFNEDYYQLVNASDIIKGITGLKVWQQREQELEQSGGDCWVNKVWFSYTLENDTEGNRTITNNQIESLVYSVTEGKYPLFVLPDIIPLTVTIDIINNISKKIPLEVQKKIEDDIKGIYDDKYKKISKTIAYRSVFTNLQGYNTDIDLGMTDKGNFKNNKFYNIDSVILNISERGW